MRRSGFSRPVPERRPVVLTRIAPQDRRGVMAPAGGAVVAVPKPVTFRSEAWRRAVASLPCVVCGREGATQAAHPNHIGKGMATKASDAWCVPLCVEHHAEFDQGRRWTKQEKRELMTGWIIETINELAARELVRAI